MSSVEFRLATPDDAGGMLAIYAPIIEETAISFEDTVPALSEYRERFEEIDGVFPVVVAVDGKRVAGFAYAGLHRVREAYRWSVETSVYVDPPLKRLGIGRGLYTTVFELLKAQNYANALAGITLPNDDSVKFHESMGFTRIGIYPGVGYKFGEWRDTEWWNYRLQDRSEPSEPVALSRLGDATVNAAIDKGMAFVRQATR